MGEEVFFPVFLGDDVFGAGGFSFFYFIHIAGKPTAYVITKEIPAAICKQRKEKKIHPTAAFQLQTPFL